MVVIGVETDKECQSTQRGGDVHELTAHAAVRGTDAPQECAAENQYVVREGPHLIHKLLKSNLFRGRRLWRR